VQCHAQPVERDDVLTGVAMIALFVARSVPGVFDTPSVVAPAFGQFARRRNRMVRLRPRLP